MRLRDDTPSTEIRLLSESPAIVKGWGGRVEAVGENTDDLRARRGARNRALRAVAEAKQTETVGVGVGG